MKIALINGSPKGNSSASGALLEDLKKYISEGTSEKVEVIKIEIMEIGLHNTIVSKEALEEMSDAKIWVFACPLYVDGIPAHLLSCLVQLEEINWPDAGVSVYGIVNCGFYEGIQARSALDILRNWCIKTGFTWSGGIGVGGGGALRQMPSARNGHGPKAPVENALGRMADNIFQRKVQENHYVSVAFPRVLYQMAAQMGWRQMIRANGGKAKDLGDRPE